MFRVYIAAISSYLPERCIHNDELAESLDTSDEWIYSHTGITYRRIAAPDESPSKIGAIAARDALEKAGVSAEEIGMILLSTTTPDYAPIPSTACVVQDLIGAKNAVGIDITAACTGFVYGLELARAYMQLHNRPILVVSTEMMSRVTDWSDRKTCVLFGDGAAAAVLLPSPDGNRGIIDTLMQSDASNHKVLVIDGGCRTPTSRADNVPIHMFMDGKAVFTFAIRVIPDIINRLLQDNDLTIDDIDWIVPHQANYRIIKSAAARLKVPESKFFINVQDVANTASASIPIALVDMQKKGLLRPGHKIITVGFGAGLCFGGNLIVW
ncbi:MAG: ketoacyl-ACP synthase III [Planctomycetaceae bacterium]|nr:ketoacyl-ACP synthase III [Planctomycetaceae bacterium]